MPECYVRGSTIKYLRIPDEVIDNYKEDSSNRGQMNRRGGGDRGGRGGPGQRGGRGGSAGGRGGFNNNNRRNNAGSNQNLSGSGMPPAAKQQRR